MTDVHITELAGRQFDRVSRQQLLDLGLDDRGIEHRLLANDLVVVEQGVYACPPILDDPRGRFMAATLTAPDTFLSHASLAAALGCWRPEREIETVTRPGNGGPRRFGDVLVFRSETLEGETGLVLGCIPATTPERLLIDMAPSCSPKMVARLLRDLVREQHTTIPRVVDALQRHRGRRGTVKLGRACAQYAGLPIEKARSGAEVQAMIVIRDAGLEVPALNRKRAGVEADLSWPRHRLIIEIDGGIWHLDHGEDSRRQAIWEAAGWTVLRISDVDVYHHPERLLTLCPR